MYGDWGPSAFDVRRNFVANVTYEVPAGSTSGIARAILSNWQVSAILALQDGTPFSALTGFSQSRDLARSVADRPSLAPGARDNPVLGGADHYFDTSAFLLQAPGTYGNVGRNTLVGPGLETLDAALVRRVSVGGPRMLQLRLEAFNLLNHTNLALPDANIFNSNGTVRGAAGRITSTSTTSRQIQLGVKFQLLGVGAQRRGHGAVSALYGQPMGAVLLPGPVRVR